MHPYRIDNPSSLNLSFKDKLWLSGNPYKRIVYYIVSCLDGIYKILFYGSAVVGAGFIGWQILRVIGYILEYLTQSFPTATTYGFVGLLITMFLIAITNIMAEIHKGKLEKKIDELNNPSR